MSASSVILYDLYDWLKARKMQMESMKLAIDVRWGMRRMHTVNANICFWPCWTCKSSVLKLYVYRCEIALPALKRWHSTFCSVDSNSNSLFFKSIDFLNRKDRLSFTDKISNKIVLLLFSLEQILGQALKY